MDILKDVVEVVEVVCDIIDVVGVLIDIAVVITDIGTLVGGIIDILDDSVSGSAAQMLLASRSIVVIEVEKRMMAM